MTVITELADRQLEGRKSWREKVRWARESLGIQLRTRKWVRWGLALILIGAGALYTARSYQKASVAPASLCECPLKKETPKAGKKQKAEVKNVSK